ncbi:hypothetical protein BX600DRAFT_477554 [Xylariales sp. PMI_506]|nr:hypothetical protein BX600DRAFT_477554 [Xylariales sp. PMI_506]
MLDTSRNQPATRRALLIPEILSQIFFWISQDDSFYHTVHGPDLDELDEPKLLCTYEKEGALVRCGQVSKLWCSEAMPYAWRNLRHTYPFERVSLPRIIGAVEPDRRQRYADMVEIAIMVGVASGEEADDADAAIHGVEFPNLKEVTMPLAGFNRSEHIPVMGKNTVKVLNVDPSFDCYPDTYRVDQDEMKLILEQIPAVFPHLEELNIVDACLAYPGALEDCARRLPKLKKFDHSSVIVGMDYPQSRT